MRFKPRAYGVVGACRRFRPISGLFYRADATSLTAMVFLSSLPARKSIVRGILLLTVVSQIAEARVAHPDPDLAKPPPSNVKASPVLSAYQREEAMTPTQLILRWKPFVAKASHHAGVPAAWINAVMRVESGGRTMLTETQPMISSKGALGLMQVLPQTYQEMRAQYKLGPNPFDPKDNINAGAGYLRWLRTKYGYPTMFAAYNAGPGQVDDTLAGGKRLPAETQVYVARVGEILDKSGGPDGTFINAAKLTRPDGSPVLIDPLAVSAIRAAVPGEYPDGVQTVLSMGRLTQGVREDIRVATAAIRIRGGKV
jgi:soluble lytic murein transglycosylase-like protein